MHVSLLLTLSFLSTVATFFREHRDENIVAEFSEVIKKIVKVHEEERVSILTHGRWYELGSWSSVRQLTNGAYHLALMAIEQVHDGKTPTEELEALNQALLKFSPFMKSKSLKIFEDDTTLAINFTLEEQFENGTMANTPNSLKYLPIMGMLFNANSHSPFLLGKLVEACQVYHPVQIIRELATGLEAKKPEKDFSEKEAVREMIRLEAHAAELKFVVYRLIIMYAECLALSQKPFLKDTEPKHIATALPHFTTALNLLQKKFMLTAELIQPLRSDL